jgi:hypothetical protein
VSDIKKQLVIKATLDSSALKKEIATLKRELKAGFSLSSQDTSSIKSEFKNIAKSFADELKKAMQGAGPSGAGGGGGGKRASRRHSMFGEDYDIGGREGGRLAKIEEREMAKQEKMADRARNKELREQQRVAQQVQKFNQKGWDDNDKEIASSVKEKLKGVDLEKKEQEKLAKIKQKEESKLGLMKEKDRKKDLDQSIKNLETLRQKRLEQATENSRLDRTPVAMAGRAMGMSPEGARDMARGMSGSNITKFAGGAAAIGGGVLAATRGINDIRTTMIERSQRYAQDIEEGSFIAGQARKAGRDEMSLNKAGTAAGGALVGAGGGAAAGALIGSIVPVIGTAIGAAIGGLGGAAYGGVKGYFSGSEAQGELRAQQVAPLERSFQYAKGMNPARLSALQGGGVNSDTLTGVQSMGTMNGYSPQETINQFLQARGSLGNKATAQGLSGMQGVARATGMDVGTQAQTIEALTGTGQRGQGHGRSFAQQNQIIERAISAGLDRSKTSQFMKATSDYLQSSAGFGRVDTQGISSRMTDFAQGFAGGGPITSTAIQQAQSLNQLTKSESTSEAGFSGIGNITGLQKTFADQKQELDPGLLMSLSNLSSDARPEDVKKLLMQSGKSAAEAEALMPGIMDTKVNASDIGAKAAGVSGTLKTAMIGRERGITTEQQMGIEDVRAAGGAKAIQDGSLGRATAEVMGSQEAKMATTEARIDQTKFEQGFSAFDAGISGATQGLQELTKVFAESSKVFYKLVEQGSKANLTKGDVK